MIMRKESISTAVIKNNPKVIIILLNYNRWRDTIECLESIYKITYPNWELILVDNGSEDGSVSRIKEWAGGKIRVESKFFKYDEERKPIEYIEELLLYDEGEARVKVLKKEREWDTLLPHQKLSILRIEENRGFTGGNNIGIKYILREKKTDYILLLNNDTFVDGNFLTELVKVAESDPKIGIVGPKIYYYDEPNKIWFAGGKINRRLGKTKHLGVHRIDKGQFESIKKVDYITGCAFLVKDEVFDKIGLLDNEYFFCFEDLDFCIRAQKEQYYCFYIPKAKIWHKVSQSGGGRIGHISLYYNTRNRALFMKKNGPLFDRICFFPFYLIRFVLIPVIYCMLKLKIRECLAVLQGFFDFLSGRSGKAKNF